MSADPCSGVGGRQGLGGKPAYLRTALAALAAVRAIWGLDCAEKAKLKEKQSGIKLLVGTDYDSLKNQNGVPVSRQEAERALGLKLDEQTFQ